MESNSVELAEINEYFKTVIDLVPADVYFESNSSREDSAYSKQKWMKKDVSGPGPRAKEKLVKKRKFDPQFMKTTSQRISQGDEEDDIPLKKIKSNSTAGQESSINDLHERLKNRIAELELKRTNKNRTVEETEIIRARRRKERAKFKLKKQMKNRQQKGTNAEFQGLPGQKNAKVTLDGGKLPNGGKPIVNSEGKVVFSKFDFGGNKADKKSKKNVESSSGKKLKVLLAKAENKSKEMETLKSTDPEKAKKVKHEELWGKALAKAEGTKLKDNPELLKKSMKKEAAIKKQHAKKWKERDQTVKEKMQRRQDRRERNIQARKDHNKEKKISKRMKKFSKSIPGF